MEQTKQELYTELNNVAPALMANERHAVANLANIAALLGSELPDINWAGFYLMDGGELVLGPFWGKPACLRIPLTRGVCGAAASAGKNLLVPDVHLFAGHIGCDAASASEIVLPLRRDGRVIGVLDLDSPRKNRFDAADEAGLDRLARALEAGCDFSRCGYSLR